MSYCKYLELESFPYSQHSVCVIFIHSFIPLDKYLLRVYSVPPCWDWAYSHEKNKVLALQQLGIHSRVVPERP